MALRALWVFCRGSEGEWIVAFFRKYPVIEREALTTLEDQYVPLPNNDAFTESLQLQLGLDKTKQEFIPGRDSCSKFSQAPVFEIPTERGPLWPVVVIDQYGCLFCGLPLTEKQPATRPQLVEIIPVTVCFTLLLGLIQKLGPLKPQWEQDEEVLGSLRDCLSVAAPVGRVIETDMAVVQALVEDLPLHTLGSLSQNSFSKSPVTKGKGSVRIKVVEHLKAAQHELCPDLDQETQLYGNISCQWEGEGPIPELTFPVRYQEMRSVLTHPRALLSHVHGANEADRHKSLKVFPYPGTMNVCYYHCQIPDSLPVSGVFKSRGSRSVEFLLQLRLNPRVKNSFEYFEARIPFADLGAITVAELNPNWGQCLLSSDRKHVVWNVGTKFPPKTLEVTLSASLQFVSGSRMSVSEDPGSTDRSSSNAQIYYKILDFTHSGMSVDSRSVQVVTGSKVKVTTERELVCVDHRIWNSHGDPPLVNKPSRDLIMALDEC